MTDTAPTCTAGCQASAAQPLSFTCVHAENSRRAHEIADRACICDVESEGFGTVHPDGHLWYDVRPMLDEREHSTPCVDMNRQSLDYGVARGLLVPHPQHQHLVRIVRRP